MERESDDTLKLLCMVVLGFIILFGGMLALFAIVHPDRDVVTKVANLYFHILLLIIKFVIIIVVTTIVLGLTCIGIDCLFYKAHKRK